VYYLINTPMHMNFSIAPSDPTPIYRQIVEQVRRQIAGRQMRLGMELPSVRAVAQQHAINPMTVSKAYSLLEAEGLLERRRGMGMVVADHSGQSDQAQLQDLLRPSLQAAAQQARQLGLSAQTALAQFEECLKKTHQEETP
jgi:GntR family transcriptional regulator